MWDQLFTAPMVWFAIPALIGTLLFVIKVLLMLLGMGHDADFHADAAGMDVAHAHDGSDAAFKLLSLQGILAFAMGFGWAGLLVLTATKWQMPVVFGVAVVSGVALMYLMAALMGSVMQLQSSGNVEIGSTVGTEGTVYVTVPGENRGSGQVMLVVDQKQRTYNAVTTGGELPRHARVRVIAVHGQNTLNVEPA